MSESPIDGSDAAKWFTSRVNTGTISATRPAIAANPSSSPSVAPIAAGDMPALEHVGERRQRAWR